MVTRRHLCLSIDFCTRNIGTVFDLKRRFVCFSRRIRIARSLSLSVAMEGETSPDELEEQVVDQVEAEEQQEGENVVDEDVESPAEIPPLTGETTPQETQATAVSDDAPSSTVQNDANTSVPGGVSDTLAAESAESAAAAGTSAAPAPALIAETKKELNIPNTMNIEPVVEEVKRDPNMVSVTLRAVDNGWVMGVDWIVDFHNLMTMGEIRTYVEQYRGISRHRIQLRLKGKVLPANREIWTLRRMGIYDGYTILIEPTIIGGWLWEPKEYYANKLLDEVCEIVTNTVTPNGSGRINLKVLNEKIKPPPCIKSSLRVFLRQYPERIYIHTDTSENELWVHVTKRPFQLPTFGTFSVEIGTFPYYKPKRFDWAGNKEIDDMYKIETLPVDEEEVVPEEGADGAAAPAPQEAVLTPEEAARREAIANEQNAREAALNDNESYTNDSYLGEESYVTGDPE